MIQVSTDQNPRTTLVRYSWPKESLEITAKIQIVNIIGLNDFNTGVHVLSFEQLGVTLSRLGT